MNFKNLNPYKFDGRLCLDEALSALDARAFRPCRAGELSAEGFVNVLGSGKRLKIVGSLAVFCWLSHEKILPKRVLNLKVNNRIKEIQNSGVRVEREQREAIRQEVMMNLLSSIPDEYVKINEIWSYIDLNKNLLICYTTSPKCADHIATVIGSVRSVRIRPLIPDKSIAVALGKWLSTNNLPKDFELGCKCELIDCKNGVVKYTRLQIEDMEIVSYLQSGMTVKSLELKYKSFCSFVLTDDFLIKELVIEQGVENDYILNDSLDPIECRANIISEIIEFTISAIEKVAD